MPSFQWWRSWHNAPMDHKWTVIAVRAGVKTGIVSAVAWALMDYASQAKVRGSVTGFDPEEYAVYSGFEESDIAAVIRAMQDKGFIDQEGMLTNWTKRQPQREDDSTERVRKWRAMKRNETHGDAKKSPDKIKIKDTDREGIKQDNVLIGKYAAREEGAGAPPPPAVPAKTPKTRAKKPTDPRLQHPALLEYRRRVHYCIVEDWRDAVIETVGSNAEGWGRFIVDWVGRGYNKFNISGMLDAYRSGGLKPNGSGRPGKTLEPAGFAGLREYASDHGMPFDDEPTVIIDVQEEADVDQTANI